MAIPFYYILKERIALKPWLTLGLAVSLVLFGTHSRAQTNPLFTQYMFNGLVINPAYTGSHESMTMTVAYRAQWTGLAGAPQTQVASMHSPLKFSRSAAGIVLVHDEIGVTNMYTTYATYAYRIPVAEGAKLAIGAQAGMTYYKSNYEDLVIITPNGQPDPAFSGSESRFLPNLGIGIYYYSRRAYVGLSLPTIINNKWDNQDATIQARQKRHYFLTAGYLFNLTENLKLKPNTLLKFKDGNEFQFDLNANLYIHDIVSVGVSYRWKDSFDGLAQWNITDQLSLGYSYGYPITNIGSIQKGTHEVVLNYRFKREKDIIFSPRYF